MERSCIVSIKLKICAVKTTDMHCELNEINLSQNVPVGAGGDGGHEGSSSTGLLSSPKTL